eukprot:354250-Chlamydomonas_euryale.AAC.4
MRCVQRVQCHREGDGIARSVEHALAHCRRHTLQARFQVGVQLLTSGQLLRSINPGCRRRWPLIARGAHTLIARGAHTMIARGAHTLIARGAHPNYS